MKLVDDAEQKPVHDTLPTGEVFGRSNVSRAVSDLVRAGLLTRHYQGYEVDHQNRGAQRQVGYTITPEARSALGRAASPRGSADQRDRDADSIGDGFPCLAGGSGRQLLSFAESQAEPVAKRESGVCGRRAQSACLPIQVRVRRCDRERQGMEHGADLVRWYIQPDKVTYHLGEIDCADSRIRHYARHLRSPALSRQKGEHR